MNPVLSHSLQELRREKTTVQNLDSNKFLVALVAEDHWSHNQKIFLRETVSLTGPTGYK